MIDLTKNQIVDPPVKCWVRDSDKNNWVPTELYAIDHRHSFLAYQTTNHRWKQCTLVDPVIPTKKIKKWLTVEDVPAELWGRALFKEKKITIRHAEIMSPKQCTDRNGYIYTDLVYLPLGQPLTGEWLPFESEE